MESFLAKFDEKDKIRGEGYALLFSFLLFLDEKSGRKKRVDGAFKKYEEFVCEKRRKWFEEVGKKIVNGRGLEDLYKLFTQYHGLNEKNHVILEKSEKRIIIGSMNACPVLYACRKLGLDTREICKKVYEKPAAYLLKLLNPNSRFSRDYEKIRPYYECCVEIIELIEPL